jgi:hypothetical protein
MADYFGRFRIGKRSKRTVTLTDGTTKSLAIVSNPIDSGTADTRFEGRKLTKSKANELWNRDKDKPFLTPANQHLLG